jgi:TonB family protein
MLAGAVILAAAVIGSSDPGDPSDYQNPKFFSPNGEMCLVIRRYPKIGDFDRVTSEAYWRRDPIDEWLDQYPLPDTGREEKPEPLRAALYRRWPGGHQALLSELALSNDADNRVLVANDGHVVTYAPLRGQAEAELLTIHAPDGSVVRTLLARDVLTRNDQQWLYRGSATDVRWSIHDDFGTPKLRATILVTDGKWEDAEARHEILEIDLATGAVPPPARNLCPAALLVVAEADDGTAPRKPMVSIGDQQAFDDRGVIPFASQALLDRAVTRIIPEYPEVAGKARIAGRVRVEVVVGRDGRVEAARIEPLPFGIDNAVKTAIEKWEFAPYPSAVEAVRFTGSFAFRFEIVRPHRIEPTTIRCHWGSVSNPPAGKNP